MPLKGEEGFLLGCDPEIFLVDSDGNPVSAYGILPGTKEEPFAVEDGTVQVDGMAAEIGIHPAASWEEWEGRISNVLRQLEKMLPKGVSLCYEPAVRFSQSVMDAMPEEVKKLGCEPDFNAWTGKPNPAPDRSNDPLLACIGGHIHFGWFDKDNLASIYDEDHQRICFDFVKQCDWFLGAWAMRFDKNLERRQLYGKAGSCRVKPYGVEYRTLSSFWLRSRDMRMTVWNRAQEAIKMMPKMYLPKMYEKDNEKIVEFINSGTKKPRGYGYPLDTLGGFAADDIQIAVER